MVHNYTIKLLNLLRFYDDNQEFVDGNRNEVNSFLSYLRKEGGCEPAWDICKSHYKKPVASFSPASFLTKKMGSEYNSESPNRRVDHSLNPSRWSWILKISEGGLIVNVLWNRSSHRQF